MAYWFNKEIDAAIDALFCKHDIEAGRQSFQQLQTLEQQGDADAKYLLSRCFSGSCYVWEFFELPENDQLARQYLMEAVEGGSAMAVLGALRLVGVSEEEAMRRMPFRTLKEAWDIVYKKAEAGCAFCQYLIGNTYYWLDILLINNVDLERDFPDAQSARNYCADMVKQSIPWLEQAIRGGMDYAARNLCSLYRTGRDGLIPPQPEKRPIVMKLAADTGSPEWMYLYGTYLRSSFETEREGFQYCLRAAESGQYDAWYEVSRAYNAGVGVPKDQKKAYLCAEKGLGHPSDEYCASMVGMYCFEGFGGVPVDYARAVKLLQYAKDHKPADNTWENDRLAFCYMQGLGCTQDIPRAISLLHQCQNTTQYTNYLYGILYTQGISTPQNIKKGVAYLQKAAAANLPAAQEELKKYRRTWYGKWVCAE